MALTQPIDLYQQFKTQDLSATASISSLLSGTLAGNGQSLVASSDVEHKQAKAFRFNSALAFDVYSPQATLNTNQTTFQFKSLTSQVTNNQWSTINSWLRAENLNVVQAKYNYTYIDSEHLTSAPIILTQASTDIKYADHMKIQIGQLSGVPVVNGASLGSNYGVLSIGATKDILFSSNSASISHNAKTSYAVNAGSSISIEAGQQLAITSQTGSLINSNQELSLTGGTSCLVSGQQSLSLSSSGTTTLDGTIISIGSGGGLKPPINLDILSLASSAISGDLSNILSTIATGSFGDIVSSLGTIVPGDTNLSNAFTSLLGSTGITSITGLVNSATSALGTPSGEISASGISNIISSSLGIPISNITSTILAASNSGQSLTSLAGNVAVSTLSSTLSSGQYGSLLSSIIGPLETAAGLTPIGSVTFDVYPQLQSLQTYSTNSVPGAQQSVVAAGATFFNFPLPNNV